MVVEERYGSLDNDDYNVVPGRRYPLFGQQQVSQQEADEEALGLFAARLANFSNSMESSYEHYLLKQDLVEHINSLKKNA